MAIRVKSLALWRAEIENRPGALAGVLEPLQAVGLQVVMGYRYPGNESRAAVEVYPITGKKAVQGAQAAGLSASSIPALLVEGDDKPGLGYAICAALAEAGINIDFLIGQVVGRKYSTVIGFETEEQSRKAVPLIKKAAASRRKSK
jgi:hypothetical protein